MRAGVGSIKGVFRATSELEDLQRAANTSAWWSKAKAQPGFLKGLGRSGPRRAENVTTVSYTGDVQVGGTIASVGQRMIQGTAKMMAAQFFTCLGAEAKTEVGEPPPQHGFFRTALRWFSGLLKRLLKPQKGTKSTK